ncbi:SDR family oxidoreductase [Nocardiopsis sp. ATB16-24]|uniref:SDR family NAD(P)-dependent oxidoreductase n=1 Tax=Nocardiopsis sp. ATB16-24 TaxID=3019555 RepID=UPI002554F0B2|nr:SDR family oxidoreductase [Nocardiopsis sp. ATB16-24]
MSKADLTTNGADPVVVVTGASQGIGAEIVDFARKEGWRVAAFDVKAFEGEQSERVRAWRVDIADEGSVATALADAERHFGRLDALVNAAALFTALDHKPFTEIDVDEWDRVFSVNVRGAFLLSKHITPMLRRAGGGSIVLFSSNVVSFGMKDFMHYVSSKAAVVGMVRGLARELGSDGIRANAVAPGFVTTEVTAKERTDDYREALIARQVIPVPTVPEEICSVVGFLISDQSKAMTGQTLFVNRGTHMGAV